MKNYDTLMSIIKKVSILGSVEEVLYWDQSVMMPKGASDIRSMEFGVLAEISHDMFTQSIVGTLIKKAKEEKLDTVQKANVREVEIAYARSTKVPVNIVTEFAKIASKAHHSWENARSNSDYAIFAPDLKKIVDISQKIAHHIDKNSDPFEVMFKEYEHDFSLDDLNTLFTDLKKGLVPLIKQIKSSTINIKTEWAKRNISVDRQKKLNKKLAEVIGYDFSKGRLDESAHPFTCAHGRITTRYTEGWISAILSVLHEAGHGMYEHNLPNKHFGTPAGEFRSLSVHESQSRFWENHIGKSRHFCKYLVKQVKKEYGITINLDEFYKLVNRVDNQNLIRVEADELTYSLHILLRFEIERDILNNKLKVNDIPKEWNRLMKTYFGIVPKKDSEGCLQDMHWTSGFGYFPTYTIGSMISAQIYAKMKKDIPHIEKKISNVEFDEIHRWLKDKIHSKGKVYTTKELIKRATGKELRADDYIAYLTEKYSEIYKIQLP